MKPIIKLGSVLLISISLILPGCGNKGPASNPGTSGQGKPSGPHIGMVTDTGGVNDKSFNQSAWEGLQRLEKDTGARVKYLQSKSDADYVTNLNTFVKDNYLLSWGIGFLISDAVKQVAAQNKDAKLGIIDNVVDAPNVVSVTFAENEALTLSVSSRE